MGIENDLKRIADALEMLVEQNGKISTLHVTAAPAEAADPLAVPAKRGRPAKDPVAAAPAAPAPDATPKEKITEQVLREELRQYIVRHETKGKGKGMEAATAVLVKFNAKTVSTIKPEDYAAIVELCREDKKKYDAASKK